jgi:hypothetical protein
MQYTHFVNKLLSAFFICVNGEYCLREDMTEYFSTIIKKMVYMNSFDTYELNFDAKYSIITIKVKCKTYIRTKRFKHWNDFSPELQELFLIFFEKKEHENDINSYLNEISSIKELTY